MASNDSQNSHPGHQDPAANQFARDGPSPVDSPVTANELLLGAYDPTRLHPLAQLGDQLDYLVLDDDKVSDLPGAGTAIPSRGWSDDLCYGTGTMYLGGKSVLSIGSLTRVLHEFCTFDSCIFSTAPSHLIIMSPHHQLGPFLLFSTCHMLIHVSARIGRRWYLGCE